MSKQTTHPLVEEWISRNQHQLPANIDLYAYEVTPVAQEPPLFLPAGSALTALQSEPFYKHPSRCVTFCFHE